MSDALDEQESSVSIVGWLIFNFLFAGEFVDPLDTTTKPKKWILVLKRQKMMTNNPDGLQSEIRNEGQGLETVGNFKCLRSISSSEGHKTEIFSGIV